jgi:hypothetical protein
MSYFDFNITSITLQELQLVFAGTSMFLLEINYPNFVADATINKVSVSTKTPNLF